MILSLFFSLLDRLVLKVGDEKTVIALISWHTLIMICGVGMLISLGVEVGVIYELDRMAQYQRTYLVDTHFIIYY